MVAKAAWAALLATLIVSFIVASTAYGCGAQMAGPPTPEPTVERAAPDVVGEVNAFREGNALKALEWSSELADIATELSAVENLGTRGRLQGVRLEMFGCRNAGKITSPESWIAAESNLQFIGVSEDESIILLCGR